jgi:hypothetical protein
MIGILLLLLGKHVTAQNKKIKTVVITKTSVIVPEGKRWSIMGGDPVKIQVSNGSLQSGTLCNANLLSNPNMIGSINRGSYFNPEQFGIIFKALQKVPYKNQNTFEITPVIFIGKDFSVYDLQNHKIEELGKQRVEFLQGDTLHVSNCLESIEIVETSLTAKEIENLKKTKEKEIAEKQRMESEDSKRTTLLELEIQKQNEEEFKQKILDTNSVDYFNVKDLNNLNEFEITINDGALKQIYSYLISGKKSDKKYFESKAIDFRSSEESIITKYKFLGEVNINRKGIINKINFPTIPKHLFDSTILIGIDTLIASNNSGKINYEDKAYAVNYQFRFTYEFVIDETYDCVFRISKNKNGEIKLTHNQIQGAVTNVIDKDSVIATLKNQPEVIKLDNGKYTIRCNYINLSMALKPIDNINIKNNQQNNRFINIKSLTKD